MTNDFIHYYYLTALFYIFIVCAINGFDMHQLPMKRMGIAVLLQNDTLNASKLYDVVIAHNSLTECQVHCLSNISCSFFSLRTATRVCTLYAAGATTYSVTAKSVFAMERTTAEVKKSSSFIVLNCIFISQIMHNHMRDIPAAK